MVTELANELRIERAINFCLILPNLHSTCMSTKTPWENNLPKNWADDPDRDGKPPAKKFHILRKRVTVPNIIWRQIIIICEYCSLRSAAWGFIASGTISRLSDLSRFVLGLSSLFWNCSYAILLQHLPLNISCKDWNNSLFLSASSIFQKLSSTFWQNLNIIFAFKQWRKNQGLLCSLFKFLSLQSIQNIWVSYIQFCVSSYSSWGLDCRHFCVFFCNHSEKYIFFR